jgi:hypothetical protein
VVLVARVCHLVMWQLCKLLRRLPLPDLATVDSLLKILNDSQPCLITLWEHTQPQRCVSSLLAPCSTYLIMFSTFTKLCQRSHHMCQLASCLTSHSSFLLQPLGLHSISLRT